MNISTAVKKLEEGYRIRRDVWWDKYSLELRNNAIIMVSSVPTTHITSHNYIFAPSDLRANDWVEVSTKKYKLNKWVKFSILPQGTYTKESAEVKLQDLNTIYSSNGVRFEIEEVQE